LKLLSGQARRSGIVCRTQSKFQYTRIFKQGVHNLAA